MTGGRRRTVVVACAALLALTATPAVAHADPVALATGTVQGAVRDAASGTPIGGATVSAAGVTARTGADGRYQLVVEEGSRPVTATAYGFGSRTETVAVVATGTTGQDFALSPAGSVTVSGVVTDGSGHGWPLYARIDIAGRPGGPVFTDPATGRYSVRIAGGTFDFTTTAMYPGYQKVTRSVVVGTTDRTFDIAVPVDAGCTAAGYRQSFSPPAFSESFDAATTPTGWSVVNRTTHGGWSFADPGDRGNLTGGTGNFAIADGDLAGVGSTLDTDLLSPPVDLTGMAAPLLRFNSDFRDVGSEDLADVDASIDGGTTWTNLWHQVDSRRGPVVEGVPLDSVAGRSDVRLRFRYAGSWDWWWQIDNIAIVDRSCDPVPGGLVVGNTTDQNTGTPLNGVTVVSDDAPADRAVSAPTPDDPTLADGFYWLFSSRTGARPFTASSPPYGAVTRTVTVPANGTVRADFGLRAGRITVSPGRIESYQQLGQSRSTTVTVRNTGSAPAKIDLLERTAGFSVLGLRGAPVREVRVPQGLGKGVRPFKDAGPGSVRSADLGTRADSAWTSVPNAPVAISDNAAVTLNGKVYSIGGAGRSGNERRVFVYDIAAGTWSAGVDLPTVRSKPQAATVDGRIYVFGGWGANDLPVNTVDVFDPRTGGWSTLAAINPEPRAAAGVAVAGRSIYLVGGCVDADCAVAAETVRFNLGGTGTGDESFTEVAAYPHPVAFTSCGGIGGIVYCAGGVADDPFTDGYAYRPADDAWTPIPDLPFDLWGSADSAANGLLVLAGGITADSTTLTNRAVAYDPVADAWTELPASSYPRARGAGACGFYKIGGWSGPFTPAAEVERLGGLDFCDVDDVPWLSGTPTSFVLDAGQSRQVTVTLTATPAAGVGQPGDYSAQLGVRTNTPYAVPAVDVLVHVSAPTSWGKLQGRVTATTCGGSTVGVSAYVRINSVATPDLGYAVQADSDGAYAIWLPQGRYDVIVAKDGWTPQVQRGRVQGGFVLTMDHALRPFNPCGDRLGGV